MDESTIRGMKLLELNGSGAASPKTSIPYAVISVEGYDTLLQAYAVKLALTKHFSSCGKVTHVYVPRDLKRGILKSVAFMWITGEDCLDKALKLSGTELSGGWILIVKAAPSQTQMMDQDRPKGHSGNPHRMPVTGYNTSLPEIDLQIALCNHFSSCGEVTQVSFLKSWAYVFLFGERCVEKALKLSGSNMGGMILEVRPDETKRPPSRRNTGYIPLSSLIFHAKNTKKKLEMEMDMVMDEKNKKKKKVKKELMKIDEEIRRLMEKEKKARSDRERRMEMKNFEKSLF